MDYYLFIGSTAKGVLQQYTTITGKMPLPPKWSLGYHQSRYSYKSEKEVRELVETFKAKRVPLDAIYLDIHYMDEYRVFTFDSNRFPNPKKLIEELRKDGIRVVPIVDPGVKAGENYPIYREETNESHFCKYSKGDVYHGDVWPGRSAFPDFTNEKTRRWWGKQHKFYTDLGIEGVWNDMNEPSVFNETKTMDLAVIHENNGQPKTHGELHNIYGMMMGATTHEGLKDELANKRPFVLIRAGYAGIQRYATVWTGDNRSFWEHLQMALPMCMNLELSGVAFCGPDVGGFANDSNGELLTRWTQVGLFTPYFRNHSVLNSIHQELWSFGTRYEEMIKRYIEERYVWLPYLYNVFKEASRTGMPVMRPLLLEFPYDEQTVNIYDQFMVGEDVLVAPILTPSTNHRVVYLPEGTWIDYWTDQKRVGGKYHLVYADIDTLPIFIKEGAIIPLTAPKASTNEKDKQLFIHLYPQANESKSYTLYEDDGLSLNHETGACFECDIHMEASADQLTITTHEKINGYSPDWEERIFIIHGAIKEENIRLNDKMQFVSRILIKDNAHDS
ncbi:TIM-barrel domain-containing protein [Streptohalobacillus salinus]